MNQHIIDERTVAAAHENRTARRVAAVVGFAALTAIAARVAVPLPGTVVPFTLQPVAVLLAGALLGSRLGAASQALYLAVGAAGLPVFAAGGGAAYLLGPTGGYLLAFPVAAAVAGAAFDRDAGLGWRIGGLMAGILVLHAGGLAWLTILLGAGDALAQGAQPFVAGDGLKIVLVLVIASRLAKPIRRSLT